MADNKRVINKQVRECFIGKKDAPCPITNRLVSKGYVQKNGGYIAFAKEKQIDKPTQYWHLISSWSERRPDEAPFNRRIQCGELLVWMAETSGAVDQKKLSDLCDLILKEYVNKRREGNKIIKEACFDEIIDTVLAFGESNQ